MKVTEKMKEGLPVCNARPLEILRKLRNCKGNVWSGGDQKIVE
jgi:hypothetical protein